MNPFEFVIAVLFLVFAFAIIRHKLGMSSGSADATGGPAKEAENARLRKAVADLTLDKQILAEAARGNY